MCARENSPTRRVAIGWQSAGLLAFRAARGRRKLLMLLGPGAGRKLRGSGSEVRIISAASPNAVGNGASAYLRALACAWNGAGDSLRCKQCSTALIGQRVS
jgi:hypothetical protein